MNEIDMTKEVIWKDSILAKALLGLGLLLLLYIAFDGLATMVYQWNSREEYSHGYLIPFISAFFLWQKKDLIEKLDFKGSWAGVVITIIGLVVAFAGSVSATHTLVQYGFLAALVGFVLSYTGRATLKIIIVPLLFLFFMMPLPGIFLFRLSSELQLISSQLGVFVIRLFDISVYLEGNVIDLGVYKLQVVEACSGLRYLFPLMSLAFIAAYFFQVAFWKRAVIFLSSIPITIIMNSFRIGVIGVLVEYWGIEQAEGFLHDFEGWVVFMMSLVVIFIEMWLFVYFGKDDKSLQEIFGIDLPKPTPEIAEVRYRKVSPYLYVSSFLIIIALAVTILYGERDEVKLVRSDFNQFPLKIADWEGRRDQIDSASLGLLKLDDYLMVDYINKANFNKHSINLYSAYYNKQEAGAAAHSPKTCLPGGGWRIKESSVISLPGNEAQDFKSNRFIIQKGEHKQLVYYWFQQRGRVIASEYMVKWYLLIDAIKDGRTDGSLVRLTTLIGPNETTQDADTRLLKFAKLIKPKLNAYVPE